MSSVDLSFDALLKLPAFSNWRYNDYTILEYELGIWGKFQGTTKDYNFIANTNNFHMFASDYQERYYLGNLDQIDKSSTFMWKLRGKAVSAASISLTQRKDDKNRRSTQTIVIQSSTGVDKIPAAIQALYLLPIVEEMQSDEHILNELVGIKNLEREKVTDTVLSIDPDYCKAIHLSKEKIISAFQKGLEYVQRHYTETTLIDYYACLLEGGSSATLSQNKHFPPNIVAVLLSFLPVNMANSFSIAERLPSSRYNNEKIINNWASILSDHNWPHKLEELSPNVIEEARNIAAKLKNFSFITEQAINTLTSSAKNDDIKTVDENDKTTNITVWGPTASGKTVFLAQLFLEGARFESDWHVRPMTESAKAFMDGMRKKMRGQNLFPDGTTFEHTDDIELALINEKEGVSARLFMQDRAGGIYSAIGTEIVDILSSSVGLLLLFDPTRDEAVLEDEVWDTLSALQMKLSSDQNRIIQPVAVCLSKADDYIKTLADYRYAIEDPDSFVRSYAKPKLIELLDKYCENYILFPISSVGMKIHSSYVEPVVFYDDKLDSRIIPDDAVRSINLLEPFIWLIKNIKR